MDKVISRKFFNDQAAHWDETVRNNDPARLRALAERLDFPENAQVLDVGTGTGVFLPFIRERVNHHRPIVCMDYAFEMLDIARQKDHQQAEFVCAEIETLRFSPGLFDVAICYSTFPHFHDKPRALRNIYKLLKEGGRLYIGHTASREAINAIHAKIPDFNDHLLPEMTEMEALIKQAGFKDIRIIEKPDSYLASARR